MPEETVVQTVVLDLDTSNRKNKKIQTAIDEYQEMCSYVSDLMPSFDESQWSTMNPTFYRRLTDEFEDRTINSYTSLEAIEDVIGAWKSWRSNGKRGDRPEFGHGNYFNIKKDNIKIEENESEYGIRLNFIPYDAEWFHIEPNKYQDSYLSKIADGNAYWGTCEIHKEGDSVYAHLCVQWEVEVPQSDGVNNVVGVDIGENVIYALSVLSEESVKQVEMKNGSKFRHHRERLKQKRKEMMAKDDLRGVKKCSGEHLRYTEQVLDTASREVVDTAVEHKPCKIVLEDLTNYRRSAINAIHDWPFALFQEKIMYKSKAEGISVETIDPTYTSQTCRCCGNQSSSNRDGHEFVCSDCGYQVHADVNASMNIALEGCEYERDDYSKTNENDEKLDRSSLLEF